MKGTDKFLLAIVAGVVFLVALAFAVTLLRPERTYRPEDTAEGVAYNYLLAIQEHDYPRAYSYLSLQLKGYPPSAEAFAEDLSQNRLALGADAASTTWSVDPAGNVGDLRFVTVREWHSYGGGIFGDNQVQRHLRDEAAARRERVENHRIRLALAQVLGPG